MRDPVFYRWHQFINEIFLKHKNILVSYLSTDSIGFSFRFSGSTFFYFTKPPYTEDFLIFKDVTVDSIQVDSGGLTDSNVFQTHFERTNFNLKMGLDFAKRTDINVRYVSHVLVISSDVSSF